jgi:hypothetical protein
MSLTAAERMSFLIYCPRCGKTTEKAVAWLATNSQMRCATPKCGAIISLDAPKTRALIDKLVDQASELDTLIVDLEQRH